MTTHSNTIAARPSRTITLVGVVGFAAALAAAAQVAVPIPGTPVPLTLQPMLVVLAGLWLGPRAAAASMVLYLTAGAAGLPVFTPLGAPGVARLFGPTGGYLLAYPVAAAVSGMLAQRGGGYVARALAALAGMATLYAGGLAQLLVITGDAATAAALGAAALAPRGTGTRA
jgi:biotin transport system substrate-specific component